VSAAAANPTPTDRPSRSGRLLGLVRKLIGYGRELAATLHQRATADLFSVACDFGTRDLTLILASITRGLLRAAALQARLERSAARLDATTTTLPPFAGGGRGQGARQPHASQPVASTGAADSDLINLSLEEQIAAEVRRRPIGAVIADISRDLGIAADHPLWREIHLAIIIEGGNLVPVFRNVSQRVHQVFAGEQPAALPACPAPSPAPAATGPP